MNLTHHFLVSMPQMQDSDFRDTLVYILDHNKRGAFGVVVNQELGMDLGSVFSQLSITLTDPTASETPVLCGGPVDEGHGLVLHPPGPQFELTRDFSGGVSLSSSRDVLESIAQGNAPEQRLVLLGHAGWAPGQLENEVSANSWLTMDASASILFDTPTAARRQAACDVLGVNLAQMVGHSGHA